jgi:hypothetical protein
MGANGKSKRAPRRAWSKGEHRELKKHSKAEDACRENLESYETNHAYPVFTHDR